MASIRLQNAFVLTREYKSKRQRQIYENKKLIRDEITRKRSQAPDSHPKSKACISPPGAASFLATSTPSNEVEKDKRRKLHHDLLSAKKPTFPVETPPEKARMSSAASKTTTSIFSKVPEARSFIQESHSVGFKNTLGAEISMELTVCGKDGVFTGKSGQWIITPRIQAKRSLENSAPGEKVQALTAKKPSTSNNAGSPDRRPRENQPGSEKHCRADSPLFLPEDGPSEDAVATGKTLAEDDVARRAATKKLYYELLAKCTPGIDPIDLIAKKALSHYK